MTIARGSPRLRRRLLHEPPRLPRGEAASPTAAGSRAIAPYGTRGGSTATTCGARRRSSRLLAQDEPLELAREQQHADRRAPVRGCRSHERAPYPCGPPPPTGRGYRAPRMEGQLKRLATSGLAYQAAGLLAAFLALFTLPLYTRHLTRGGVRLRRDAADARDPHEHPAAVRDGRGVRAAVVRRRARRTAAAAWRARRRGSSSSRRRRAVAGVLLAGPLSRLILGTRDATLMAYGVLRALGVHEPRDGLRAAARQERRRTYLLASVRERRCSPSRSRSCSSSSATRARAATCWATTRASALVLLGLWCSRCASTSACPTSRGRRCGRCCASAGRPSPPTRRRLPLNVIDRSYLLRAQSADGRRPLLAWRQARDGW